MFILKIIFIFLICLNISTSYASNIKNSAVIFMYHKFGISKYPSTSVTIDQLDAHIKEFSKKKYSVKSIEFIIDTIINDGIFQITLLELVLMMQINLFMK